MSEKVNYSKKDDRYCTIINKLDKIIRLLEEGTLNVEDVHVRASKQDRPDQSKPNE